MSVVERTPVSLEAESFERNVPAGLERTTLQFVRSEAWWMASTCTSAQSSTGTDVTALLNHLAERLCKDYPNFSPDQITPQTYSVTVSFRGSGLNVDVVPILYDGDPQRELVTLHDGWPNR